MRKGNLSYYFAVKEDLLFEIIDELHENFLRLSATWTTPAQTSTTAACEKMECREALRDAAKAHVLLVCDELEQARVSYENFRFLSEERRQVIVLKRAKYEQALRDLIDRYLSVNGFQLDADVMTLIVLGTLNWPYQWFSAEGAISAQSLACTVADAVLRLLTAPPAR